MTPISAMTTATASVAARGGGESGGARCEGAAEVLGNGDVTAAAVEVDVAVRGEGGGGFLQPPAHTASICPRR